MRKMVKKAEQNIFEFSHKPYMGREDFFVSTCNEKAFMAVESWPEWLYFALCIYGPKGCGKSHLANLFAQKVMMNRTPIVAVQTIKAKSIKINNIEKLFTNSPCLIVENLSEDVDNEALFHLYNYYRDNGGNILFLAERAPAHIHFKLPDLSSRMNAVPAVEISTPDDEMLNVLLFKFFNDRQLKVSPEVLKFALHNMTRSFEYAQKLVAESDRISLIKKSPVTIGIIKEAIELLDDNKQGDFFL